MRLSMTLSLPRQPASVTRARRVLSTLLSLTETDEEISGHLAVLITEACTNAVVHAAVGSTVDLDILIDAGRCTVEVGNRGDVPDNSGLSAALPAPLTVGGRGLPLIGALADSASFARGRPGEVLLRMTKKLT